MKCSVCGADPCAAPPTEAAHLAAMLTGWLLASGAPHRTVSEAEARLASMLAAIPHEARQAMWDRFSVIRGERPSEAAMNYLRAHLAGGATRDPRRS